MSILKDNLFNLKNKLEHIEEEIVEKQKEAEKENLFKHLDSNIQEQLKQNDSTIKLNVGGQIFYTKSSTLLTTKDSLFSKLVLNYFNSNNNKEFPKELFFDRSYFIFPMILDYLRTKRINLSSISKFDLDDLEREAEYYNLQEILEKTTDLKKEIKYVSFTTNTIYGGYGTNKLEDLLDTNTATGVCINSPYELTIELNLEHEIDSVEAAGFNGNPSSWYPSYGSNAKVQTSIDKSIWKDVGTLPSSLTAQIQKVTLTPSICKYVRIKHTSYFGLGYLKFNRRID